MLCVQLGLAASVGLIDAARRRGRGLAATGLGRRAPARPRPAAALELHPRGTAAGVALGVVTGGVTLLFMAAVGPAAARHGQRAGVPRPAGRRGRPRTRRGRIWAVLAAVGVLLLTQPWNGDGRPARRRVRPRRGRVLGGVHPAHPARRRRGRRPRRARDLDARRRPGRHGGRRPGRRRPADAGAARSIGLGLAILLPVVPFTLELLALRRLTTAAFGTLMALEPALRAGHRLRRAAPGTRTCWPSLGIGCVVAAGIGAERTGARERDAARRGAAGGDRTLAPSTAVVPTSGEAPRLHRLRHA